MIVKNTELKEVVYSYAGTSNKLLKAIGNKTYGSPFGEFTREAQARRRLMQRVKAAIRNSDIQLEHPNKNAGVNLLRDG